MEVATLLHYLSLQAENENWHLDFQEALVEAASTAAALANDILNRADVRRDAAFFKDVTNLGRLLIRIGGLTYK